MTEPESPPPRALAALKRLQKLAEGNGLAPDAIKLYSADDKVFDIEGTMILSPLFEAASAHHAGGASGRAARVFASAGELKAEVDKLRNNFETKHSWINDAIAQLKDQTAGGWGLDDVRITLPNQSIVLAASATCPTCQGRKSLVCNQCQGRGSIVCPQCQGNRQELCHICLGSGQNPSLPGQPCIHCNGLRYAPCRFCHGNGQLVCPTCQGRRGTVCSNCNGAGIFTEEVSITCGARTQFRLNSQELPSGLRRGLDRLGMANLSKGHADIETVTPPVDESEEEAPLTPGEKKKEKAPKPEVHYIAHLPYTDMRMAFPGKRAMVGVFGKKSIILGVPSFLDTALEAARQKLQRATHGEDGLDEALKMRVMKDALTLQVTGKGQPPELRRLYPLGLSMAAATEILTNMRRTLNKITLKMRTLASVLCAAAGGGVFAGIFLTPLHDGLTGRLTIPETAAADGAVLAAVMAACWFMLSTATRFVLQRRFPGMQIPVRQKIGKTGLTMLAGVLAAFVLVLVLAPTQPSWLHALLAMR